MKTLIPLLLLLPGTALADLNLPTKFFCNGKWHHNFGGGICHDKTAPFAKIKLKIPPTKGQFRAVNCERELTENGNPDDFNTAVWKEGWWLWQRTVILPSKTPEIILPLEQKDNCPISMSLAAVKTGVQSSVVFYERNNDYQDFIEYSCARGEWTSTKDDNEGSSGTGVGFCQGLEKSSVDIRINATGITEIIGSSCKIISKDENTERGKEFHFEMPQGLCVLDISSQSLSKYQRTRLVLLGVKREKRELDSPTQFKDGNDRRVAKPIGTDFIATEIYRAGKIIWSSGQREEETYNLSSERDNEKGKTEWTKDSYACHTAYSAQYDSVSGSCYNLVTNQEVPYFFE